MFKIESYITPILLSYVDKYVKDFKPADAQLSLWGGGVALHNLVLKADVLQQEVALPFTLVSGRIHELLIQVPWTKIMSEPIVVTIDTIECVLSLHPPPEESPPPESSKTQVVEAPPGYMQALVRRVVSNIALRVHHLIVKYVQDDIVLSLNIKHLSVDSAGSNWMPAFADIDAADPALRRLVRLDDLTLCLDKADADGKIRFYQEPLLYRCQLDFRVLTRLVSATRRRARGVSVRLRAAKLAGGASAEQLALLVRLVRERPPAPPPAAHHAPHNSPSLPAQPNMPGASLEGARTESWTAWAWSWLPGWDNGSNEDLPAPPTPTPVAFAAYFDHVSFTFKVMEIDANGKRRARGVLELFASHAAVKSLMCPPTTLRVRFGARVMTLRSFGKCVCSQLHYYESDEEPTIYISNNETSEEDTETSEKDEEWIWPEEDLTTKEIEDAVAIDEQFRASPLEVRYEDEEPQEEEKDELWTSMEPVVYLEYHHERAPLDEAIDPYDNPPFDFQYSDWTEDTLLRIRFRPVLIVVCAGLLHRVAAVTNLAVNLPKQPTAELPVRTLTVEECEALSANLPQWRTSAECEGLLVRLLPAEPPQRAAAPPLMLDVKVSHLDATLNGPLYPHRVCSAACQLLEEDSPLWLGAHVHGTLRIREAFAGLRAAPTASSLRPVTRLRLHLAAKTLQQPHLFPRTTLLKGHNFNLSEMNIYGTLARLQAAKEVVTSLLNSRPSPLFARTTLAQDALNDEDFVKLDMTIEELSARGFETRDLRTQIITLHAARAMALHSKKGVLKQAWLLSGTTTNPPSPYLRVAAQWRNEAYPDADGIEYVGAWIEPTAFSLDPLLIAGLSYTPRPLPVPVEPQLSAGTPKTMSSSHYFMLRRTTPPSSSGRGASRGGSGAEVHTRPRSSAASSSEMSDRRQRTETQLTPAPPAKESAWWWDGERALRAYLRCRRALLSCELGLVQVFLPATTAQAQGLHSLRQALERHAETHPTIVLSLGRLSLQSSSATRYLWNDIRNDGPSFVSIRSNQCSDLDTFPWRLRFLDVSCYTLEARPSSTWALSQLHNTRRVATRAVIDLLSTTVTLSVVTKTLAMRSPMNTQRSDSPHTAQDEQVKYFTSGVDFKPSTLKEFVRGPAKNRRTDPKKKPPPEPEPTVSGPIVSVGLHIHVDTPPVTLRLEHDQVSLLVGALHGVSHVMQLLRRPSPFTVKPTTSSVSKSFIRSVSEADKPLSPSEEARSENRSELIPIFESPDTKSIKTYLWMQWVLSRATLAVSGESARSAADVDDLIATVDLQPHYSQLKLKVASASLRHYNRGANGEWEPGPLGGRMLEAREPADDNQDNHFLALTITQAQISNLPASWKEEMRPKLFEQKSSVDCLWEVYATLAPLEAVVRASAVRHVAEVLRVLAPRANAACAANAQQSSGAAPPLSQSTWQLPFFYLTAGGLRLLVTSEDDNDSDLEDTLMLNIGKVTVNPHPENPICRRVVNACAEVGAWAAGATAPEGRQYEALARAVSLRSARFHQLVHQEASEAEMMATGGENPALKWSQPQILPVVTQILHPVDIESVVAPALMMSGVLACGLAIEVNFVSDCLIDLGLRQLALGARLANAMSRALAHGRQDAKDEPVSCPYALPEPSRQQQEPPRESAEMPSPSLSQRVTRSDSMKTEAGRSVADSGVELGASQSAMKLSPVEGTTPVKKNVSIALAPEEVNNPWAHLEVFVTMGVIEATLYAEEDGSKELAPLRSREGPAPRRPTPAPAPAPSSPPPAPHPPAPPSPGTPPPQQHPAPTASPASPHSRQSTVVESKDTNRREQTQDTASANSSDSAPRSIHQLPDSDKPPNEMYTFVQTKKPGTTLQLIQTTLHQPNLYYSRKTSQETMQVSLFDMNVTMGARGCRRSLVTTERGARDPDTDISRSLATLKLSLPADSVGAAGTSAGVCGSSLGSLHLEVERPVLIDICVDRLTCLHLIFQLINKQLERVETTRSGNEAEKLPALYQLRKFMTRHGLSSVSLETQQVGVRGSGGVAGWGGAGARVAWAARPDRLSAHALVRSLLASVGASYQIRQPLLLPATMGMTMSARWEPWRRNECGGTTRQPTVSAAIEVDSITLELRPADLASLALVQNALNQVLDFVQDTPSESLSSERSEQINPMPETPVASNTSLEEAVIDHYYKDDLRSGAFKLVKGGQLPMAYQVRAAQCGLTWRYPHPRALTRLFVFPVPGIDEEVECVLELFESTMMRWEPHIYFRLPTSEPREIKIDVQPSDMVFAQMWRVRACPEVEPGPPPVVFNVNKFTSLSDTEVGVDSSAEALSEAAGAASQGQGADRGLSTEQLWSALRVDSYFAPRLLPPLRVALTSAAVNLYLHNDLPRLHSDKPISLDGYYVSKPMRCAHRALGVILGDAEVHLRLGSPALRRCLVQARISSDILECSTGAMRTFLEEFRAQWSVSQPGTEAWRARLCTAVVRATFDVPHVRTLRALANDWQHAYLEHMMDLKAPEQVRCRDQAEEAKLRLLGRVSLWLQNDCATVLRFSQHGTEEQSLLGANSLLAYRWRSPYGVELLRFSMANPPSHWRWSNYVPFTEGSYRLRLEETEPSASGTDNAETVPGAGVFLYVRVKEQGAIRTMRLSGRVTLANMLRHTMHYKMRARTRAGHYRTVGAGELHPETVGPALLADSADELTLKVKFVSHETGWSGDIPLKECPKENVPWLVKVPSGGEMTYVSVWCRVTRAQSDGRLLVALWPLYVLRSHLSLDTDVTILTEPNDGDTPAQVASIVQSAPGRGGSTHLAAPGTTAARHSLVFKYRNLECPVTRDAVPLHYGVTDTSVFDKCTPVQDLDEVLHEINEWLEQCGRESDSNWPYSLVRNHWHGGWQAALLQPRCDVIVRYAAVRAGGGCALIASLCPAALLANAAPVALTLRAHDAAPLCRLEPGHAVSPPSTLLTKPFFLSLDVGRETFVSEALSVSALEPGRYGAAPRGLVALGRAAHLNVHCNQTIALLTMYYEIKEDINVLGITSTYVLFNQMNIDIMVSTIAIPEGSDDQVVLKPKSFKVIPPSTNEGGEGGVALCRAQVWGRWRKGAEARAFACVALAGGAPVPVRLAAPPARRALALRDQHDRSVAVVVTQQLHEGRWQVAVALDPCPQFVLFNRTRAAVAVAQPADPAHADRNPALPIVAFTECVGVFWWCTVAPGASTHYSTPGHCARFPAAPNASLPLASPAPTFLTFAHTYEDNLMPRWCVPIAVAEGEHLVQLADGATLKLRVRIAPHSSLLELQDIEEHDISASDIRRRLVGSSSSISVKEEKIIKDDGANALHRVGAADNLLVGSKQLQDVTDSFQSEKISIFEERERKPSVGTSSGTTERSLIGVETSDTRSVLIVDNAALEESAASFVPPAIGDPDWCGETATAVSGGGGGGRKCACGTGVGERVRCELRGLRARVGLDDEQGPLLALHLDDVRAVHRTDAHREWSSLTVSSLQLDNAQFAGGQFDFAVVVASKAPRPADARWPPLWAAHETTVPHKPSNIEELAVQLDLVTDIWSVARQQFKEVTEVEVRVGPMALYVEDACVREVAALVREAWPAGARAHALDLAAAAAARALQRPLRLRALHVHPLDISLTLHTAVRMYIALDQSPLRLSAFQLRDMMTSTERLTHAITVHYLSAALLSAGWVVGGLELVGAPGALAARVGGAGGGVRGVAAAAAAALLRSLSAAAGSLARNLDLLAGDHDHAQRAAAARRRPPPSLLAGLTAGLTNFAINILGAVGGLAHHPVVGVCVGEAGGGAALRRGLVGALAKPLSATADLVAYAGQGLLAQTGWDVAPQVREWGADENAQSASAGTWRAECVRWTFRLAEMSIVAGFRVLLDNVPHLLVCTHKFLIVIDPETENIKEMIDLKICTVLPLEGHIIELQVKQRRNTRVSESRPLTDEEYECQISPAALARLVRYTGARPAGGLGGAGGAGGGAAGGEARLLAVRADPGQALPLHALLTAAVEHNCTAYFPLL